MPGERILLVEDEKSLGDMLADSLRARGFIVDNAYDGDSALEMAESGIYDLVLLDLMLPMMDGWEVCRRIKEDDDLRTTSIIMLTARKDERDVVAGLELGADDYIKKPFSLAELTARINAILRRCAESAYAPSLDKVEIGPLVIDFVDKQVTVEGEEVDLSPTEYSLLELLAKKNGKMVSRNEIVSRLWGLSGGETRTLDVHIWRLRKKLEKNPEDPQFIHTARGRGYRLRYDS